METSTKCDKSNIPDISTKTYTKSVEIPEIESEISKLDILTILKQNQELLTSNQEFKQPHDRPI